MTTAGAGSDATPEQDEATREQPVIDADASDATEAAEAGAGTEATARTEDEVEREPGVAALPMPVGEATDRAVDRVVRIARETLGIITEASDVGAFVGFVDEGDGVFSARFATTSSAYPGWFWTVSLTQLEDDEPNVLETELLPGDGALLAPSWVPWAERLAKYRADHAGGETARDEEDGPRAIALARRERRRVRTRVAAGESASSATSASSTESKASGDDASDARDTDRDQPASRASEAEQPEPNEAESAQAGPSSSTPRSRRTIASRRRRVTVSGRRERAANRSLGGDSDDDELVDAEDVREFVDEMDDVLDGVDFESDDDANEA